MRTPELEARHFASAAVSRMLLESLHALMGDLNDSNINAGLPELLVALAVRVSYRQDKPTSISEITRLSGISRQTVRRKIDRLIEQGVVIRNDSGVMSSDTYLQERIDADYFKRVVAAIRTAAKELENFN